MRDYLALELLSKLSAPEIRFVTRTAALDQMCGPLCDAVLGETGSAEMLESLEQAGLFVVPSTGRAAGTATTGCVTRCCEASLIGASREPRATCS